MKRQKHILILTTDAGLGHRNAAKAIAQALRHRYGDAMSIDIVNVLQDERVPGLLRRSETDYNELVTEYTDLYALGYKVSDTTVPASLVETAVALMLFGVMQNLIQQYDPDVIVATHPLCQMPLGAVYQANERHIPFITVVTDLVTIHRLWFDKTADLCVVPTATARTLALENGLSEDQISVIGIPVDPSIATTSEDKMTLRANFGWHPDMQTLLVVGGKRVDHLQQILRALNHTKLSLQLVVVAGGDKEFYQQLKNTEWHGTTHIYDFVENLPAMMLAADAIMCKAGGLIVTEALACGLPLLLIDVLPGQEQGNADYVIEGGAATLAETPLSALETVYHWFEQGREVLKEKARCAQKLGNPRAAYDIADKIWALANGKQDT